MTAIADVLTWSAGRPAWQRDALRRLVVQGTLSADDVDGLLSLCKAQQGLVDPETPPLVPIPLTAADIAPGTASGTVELMGIRDVQNVNALAKGQKVGFNPVGLTVIYGDNASGKSGYARILKHLCRARARGGPILSCVFEDASDPPPSATVDYRVAGAARSVAWQQGQAAPAELSNVSFFDSACASVQVRDTNKVDFTPFGLDLLSKLAGLCQTIQTRTGFKTDNFKIAPCIGL